MSHNNGKKPPFIFVFLLLICLIFVSVYFAYFSKESHKANSYFGDIEGQSYDVSTAVPGMIKDVLVKEGDLITAGQVVAKLDDSEMVLKKEKATQAALSAAAQNEKANLPARKEEIAIQRNTIAQLLQQQKNLNNNLKKNLLLKEQNDNTILNYREAMALKKKQLDSMRALVNQGSAKKTDLDYARQEAISAKAAYDNAVLQKDVIASDGASLVNQIESARLQIASAVEKLKVMEAGLEAQDKAVAAATSAAAQLEVEIASLNLEKFNVISEVAGMVESVNFQKGTFANIGTPILTLVDLSELKTTLYINETDLSVLKVGDTLSFTLANDPTKNIIGQVTAISSEAMFTPLNVVIAKDRDRLVFEVSVKLEPTEGFKPGMLLNTELGN